MKQTLIDECRKDDSKVELNKEAFSRILEPILNDTSFQDLQANRNNYNDPSAILARAFYRSNEYKYCVKFGINVKIHIIDLKCRSYGIHDDYNELLEFQNDQALAPEKYVSLFNTDEYSDRFKYYTIFLEFESSEKAVQWKIACF